MPIYSMMVLQSTAQILSQDVNERETKLIVSALQNGKHIPCWMRTSETNHSDSSRITSTKSTNTLAIGHKNNWAKYMVVSYTLSNTNKKFQLCYTRSAVKSKQNATNRQQNKHTWIIQNINGNSTNYEAKVEHR